jgi:hypothetical protein
MVKGGKGKKLEIILEIGLSVLGLKLEKLKTFAYTLCGNWLFYSPGFAKKIKVYKNANFKRTLDL